MWIFGLAVLVMMEGVLGTNEFDCENSPFGQCYLRHEPQEPSGEVKTKEDFQQLCKNLLRIEICLGEYEDVCPPEDTDPRHTAVVKARKNAIIMCDVNSELYKGIENNFACIAEVMQDSESTCREKGVSAYSAYAEPSIETDEIDEADYNEDYYPVNFCIVESFTFFCIIGEVSKVCGEEAHLVMNDATEKLDIIGGMCTPEAFLEMTTQFSDFLEEHPELDIEK